MSVVVRVRSSGDEERGGSEDRLSGLGVTYCQHPGQPRPRRGAGSAAEREHQDRRDVETVARQLLQPMPRYTQRVIRSPVYAVSFSYRLHRSPSRPFDHLIAMQRVRPPGFFFVTRRSFTMRHRACFVARQLRAGWVGLHGVLCQRATFASHWVTSLFDLDFR